MTTFKEFKEDAPEQLNEGLGSLVKGVMDKFRNKSLKEQIGAIEYSLKLSNYGIQWWSSPEAKEYHDSSTIREHLSAMKSEYQSAKREREKLLSKLKAQGGDTNFERKSD